MFAVTAGPPWVTVVLAVLAAIGGTGGLATMVIGYLNNQAKIKYDFAMKDLQDNVERLDRDLDSCRHHEAAAKSLAEQATQRMETAEKKAERLDGHVASLERQVADLRAEVQDLRNRLYGVINARVDQK